MNAILFFPQIRSQCINFKENIGVLFVAVQRHILEYFSDKENLIWRNMLTPQQISHRTGSDVSREGKYSYQICGAEFE
jgi:hypothetical protein